MEKELFEKVSVENEIPKTEGKYIVCTKTKFGHVNIFQTRLYLHEKNGKTIAHWGCTNQIVTHWLKPLS